MKKTLTFLSLMAAMATSAVAGTVAIAPAPVPAPAPTWETAAGVDFVSAIADQSWNPNLWGARLTFNMYKPATDKVTHEVNFGLGYLSGNDDIYDADIEVMQVPITLGYNAHYSLCDDLSVFAGAKLGLNIMNAEASVGDMSDSETDLGWQWSIGTGIKYNLNEKADLVLSYEFTRVYTDYTDKGQPGANANLGYHCISLGLRFPF